jgi:hypothetical protein
VRIFEIRKSRESFALPVFGVFLRFHFFFNPLTPAAYAAR